MKKAKYILIGGGILIFVAYILHFLWEPRSQSELFDANYLSITPEKGTSSFNSFSVQEYNGQKYFLDKGNLVSQKDKSDKKEIEVKDVCSFLINDDELVYVLFDETDKVHVKNLQNNEDKNISMKDAHILLNDNEYVYIYSEENLVYKFDKQWNEVKIFDLNKDGFKGLFERACIIEGKIVFATESLKLYVYDEQKETLQKVKLPKKENHSEDGDIIAWKGNVYYMLSYYDDGDLHVPFTRIDSSQNGIYRLNVDNKEMEKVSNEVGEIMLVKDNQLCIADTHFWGISYRINSVVLKDSTEDGKAQNILEGKNVEENSKIQEAFKACSDYPWLSQIQFSPCAAIENKVKEIEGKNSIKQVSNFKFEKCNLCGQSEDIIMLVDVETQRSTYTFLMVFLSGKASEIYNAATYDNELISYKLIDVDNDSQDELLVDCTVVSNGTWRYINILQFSNDSDMIYLFENNVDSLQHELSYYFSSDVPKKFILKDVYVNERKKMKTEEKTYCYRDKKYVLE